MLIGRKTIAGQKAKIIIQVVRTQYWTLIRRLHDSAWSSFTAARKVCTQATLTCYCCSGSRKGHISISIRTKIETSIEAVSQGKSAGLMTGQSDTPKKDTKVRLSAVCPPTKKTLLARPPPQCQKVAFSYSSRIT